MPIARREKSGKRTRREPNMSRMARTREELRSEQGEARLAGKSVIKKRVAVHVGAKTMAAAPVFVPSAPEYDAPSAPTREPVLPAAELRSADEIEREKTYILWGGVTFFMVLIACFWLYSTYASFQRNRLAASAEQSDPRWQSIASEIDTQVEAMRETLKQFEDLTASSTASSSPVTAAAANRVELSDEAIAELAKRINVEAGKSTATGTISN